MKLQLSLLCSVLIIPLTTQAGIITGGAFANSGYIPDGSLVGSAAAASVSDYNPYIRDLSVTLNISGGYNGDLYAYLSHGGVLVPLLNRVGVTSGNAFGYADAGFANVTFSSSASGAHDVHSYQAYQNPNGGQLTGTWQPDGRAIDPRSAPSTFDSPPGGRVSFAAYNNMNPNGTWTLFLADLSAGAQSQVVSWSLDIVAEVPEPVNVALGIFAGVFLVVTLAGNQRVRNLFHPVPAH